MIACGTGHRPDKLMGYSDVAHLRLTRFATDVLSEIRPTGVISGMAIGWDMALARAAVALDIPFTAAVPFEGQQGRWSPAQQAEYSFLLSRAHAVKYVCAPGFAAWKMQRRNEWMVDNSALVIALWDGSSGGTANCVRYANARGVQIRNVWDTYANIHSHSA